MTAKKATSARSAKTGRKVTKKYAAENPDTTVRETTDSVIERGYVLRAADGDFYFGGGDAVVRFRTEQEARNLAERRGYSHRPVSYRMVIG